MKKLVLIIFISTYFYILGKSQSVDYPSATPNWIPSCNFGGTRATSSIDTWVNHWVGVGDYLDAISWFRSCTSGVSAHFIISNNGDIIQLVPVNKIAWHAGADGYNNNTRSIGVEHDVNISDPTKWNSLPMLRASVDLACYFCDLFYIPKVRALPGIRGHGEMPGVNKDCPGPLPWDTWMNMLNNSNEEIPPPINDNCPGTVIISNGASKAGTVDGATGSYGANQCEGCSCKSSDDKDVYYYFIAQSTSHTVNISNYASNFDAVIELRTACASGTAISCYDPSGTPTSVSKTWDNLIIGQTYYIRVFEYNYSGTPPSSPTFTISVTHSTTSLPDLKITNGTQIANPTNVNAGSNVLVACSEDNIGNSISGANYVTIWLSSNSTLEEGTDIKLGQISFGPIAAQSCSVVLNTTVQIPSNTNSGSYYLFFWADGNKTVNESDDDNNYASTQITITNSTSCTTPGIPNSCMGSATGQTSANLSWSAGSPAGSSTITYYWVVGTSSSVTYGNGVAQGTTASTSASTSTLSPGTTYYLRVYAKTSCDETFSGYRTSSSFTTSASCITPGIPVSVNGNATGQTTANLSWSQGSPAGSPTVTYYWVVGTSSTVTYGNGVAQSTTSGTSASVSGLSSGITYYLRVYANTSCNSTSSGYGTSSAFTTSTICTAPSAPAFCTTSIGDPANGLEHFTNLSCDPVSGVDGYSFEYSWDGIDWQINWFQTTSQSLSVNHGDNPNVSVHYRVRAYKCSPQLYSNYTYASPQTVYTACDVPAVPTVNNATSNSLNVTLNVETPVPNPSITTYSIYCTTTSQYVQTNGALGNNEVFQTMSLWGTKTVTGLSNNKEYCFYAKARNNDGDVRYNSLNKACGTTLSVSCSTPGSPMNVNGYATGQTTANLTWSAGNPVGSATVTYYWVVGTSSSVIYGNGVAQSTTTGTTVSISALSPGTSYYLRVYAKTSCNETFSGYGTSSAFTTTTVAILPTLTTTASIATSVTTALSGGNIVSDGGSPITSKGVCWGPNLNPTILNSRSTDGTGNGSYSSNISGLTPNTIYHVRAYATNSVGTGYGSDVQFSTLPTAPIIGSINQPSCTQSYGSVVLNGLPIGGTWTIIRTPGGTTITGSGSNTTISGLDPGTYTFQVTNAAGSISGSSAIVTINAQMMTPTIMTSSVIDATQSNASSGGNVTSDGGATVTARGVCWSTTSSPTILNSKTSDGLSIGTFTSTITGLINGVTYHIRAYATNCKGTAYGSDIQYIHNSTGIEDIRGDDISVFPNPVSGMLNIVYKDENFETIMILNSQGRLLSKEKVIKPNQQLDFSLYDSGLYILEFIKKTNEVRRIKVIKQ